MGKLLFRAAAVLCLIAPALPAWNQTGHRTIAFLAYGRLNEKARMRVDAILRAHPDYKQVFLKGVSGADDRDAARSAFATASFWPDFIRSDPRFTEVQRHAEWHYINIPIPHEFRHLAPEPVNVLSELRRLIKVLRKDGPVTPEEVNALPWILHLAGDVHQPLHAVARYTQVQGGAKPEHDKGGNACYVAGERNLHSMWDSILGLNFDDASVARQAASIESHTAQPRRLDQKPETWVRESVEVATGFVYSFTESCLVREKPAALPPNYKTRARQIAMQRGAMAAYRLAALLNEKFGN